MGGLAFFVACLPFTLAFDFAPIPPTPFPVGRGRFLAFLCKGLRPLHPRGLGGTRHWGCLWKAGCDGGLARAALGHGGRSCVRRGGEACFLCRLPTPPCRCPVGACFFGCLPPLPLAYFAAPLPRRGRISPRPALAERSSPPGNGEIFSFLMQGASPLASPGAGRGREPAIPAVPIPKAPCGRKIGHKP